MLRPFDTVPHVWSPNYKINFVAFHNRNFANVVNHCLFEIESHYEFQAGLKLAVLLSLSPECWD